MIDAQLQGAELSRADLSGAQILSADLSSADLSDAKLTGAVFFNSKLRRTNFLGATGLEEDALAGCETAGAALPTAIGAFPLAESAREVSTQAQNLALVIAAACFYCWVTAGSVTDAALILNRGTAKLPALGVEMPTTTFFMVAPLLLLALHIYLHLSLQRLWGLLAWLPARFPNGQSLVSVEHPHGYLPI